MAAEPLPEPRLDRLPHPARFVLLWSWIRLGRRPGSLAIDVAELVAVTGYGHRTIRRSLDELDGSGVAQVQHRRSPRATLTIPLCPFSASTGLPEAQRSPLGEQPAPARSLHEGL